MTYNIRYANPADAENAWDHRKDELAQMLLHYHPAILGVQEALKPQLDFLDEKLSTHAYVGVGRDDGKEKGEHAAIFYDTSIFALVTTQTYWLSGTPERVSIGWDAAMERITTYCALRYRKSGKILHVFNCHYDHKGHKARNKSSKLLRRLIRKNCPATESVVVMGDLNSEEHEKPILRLQRTLMDTRKQADQVIGPRGTYNDFDPEIVPGLRIDYIFTRHLPVTSLETIAARRTNGLWLSDHLPVVIALKW